MGRVPVVISPHAPRARATAALLLAGICLLPGAALADSGRPVDLGGTDVDPSYSSKDPRELEAGLWRTELTPRDHQQQQFAYTRTADDTTVNISVTATAEDTGESLSLRVFADDGTECGWETTSAGSSPWAVFGVDLAVGPDEFGDRNSPCLRSSQLRFEVGPNSTTRDIDAAMPMVIKIVEESPLDSHDETNLPESPEEEAPWRPLTPGEPGDPVVGSRSFTDAPLLAPGTHPTTVTEGEQVIFRVQLDWGQSLKAQGDLAPLSTASLEATDGFGAEVGIDILNPMRRPLDSSFDGSDSQETVDDEGAAISTGAGPLRYLNRFTSWNSYLPGDYYVTLGAPAPSSDDRDPIEIPVELTVETSGEVTGTPAYVASEPFLIGDGVRSEWASGNPPPSSHEQGWWGLRHGAGLALGVIGLGCLALGGLGLRRTSLS